MTLQKELKKKEKKEKRKEPLPTSGCTWKVAGLCLAYVVHRAFHHLEKHMQEVPTQYIVWRFAGDNGKESLDFKSDEPSVDEESARSVKWCIGGETGSVFPLYRPEKWYEEGEGGRDG